MIVIAIQCARAYLQNKKRIMQIGQPQAEIHITHVFHGLAYPNRDLGYARIPQSQYNASKIKISPHA